VADSLTATFWYGKEILEMESTNNSYSVVNDIIDKSIDQRILSQYTAFLCLEPGMMGELDVVENNRNVIDPGMDTGGIIISAEEIDDQKFEVKAYPNPFTDVVTIEIQLSGESDYKNLQCEVFDLFGKRIRAFEMDEFDTGSRFNIEWDATDMRGNKVPAGTYIFICTTAQGRISKKLVVM
jgi:hypothetical protein